MPDRSPTPAPRLEAPWLTVAMPTYNGERWVAAALASVAGQSDGVETIVVDDGSTDRTLEIVRGWSDRLDLRVVAGPRRGNWVAATNRALDLARGGHVCFLHQDDLWLDGRAAALRRALAERDDPSLIVHPALFVDPAGRVVGRWSCPLPAGRATRSPAAQERLLVQNFLAVAAPVFPRHLLGDERLDEDLWYTADWDLWLRLAARAPVYALGEPLCAFRLHPDSLTARGSAAPDEFRRQLEIVLARHAAAPLPRPPAVLRAARLSVEANVTLACLAHRRRPPLGRLAAAAAAAGPAGLRRYVRDSRIVERVSARLRVGLGRGHAPRGPAAG